MLTYPQIDPVALSMGPLQVHWYGLMYLIGFAAAWWLGRVQAGRPGSGWDPKEVEDLIFYGALGVVLGGRLGYVVFYGFSNFLDNPLYLLKIWEGGMSFHGGLLGVLVALWLYGRKTGRGFFEVGDFTAPLAPVGLLAGRIGNFINGELWGRPADAPWAIRVPCERWADACRELPAYAQWSLPLHPSQLYQAALEGLALFLILWFYARKPRPTMAVSGLFLAGYGVFRSAAELFRRPDAHIGYLAGDWLTMGQLLSLPMILAGGFLLVWAYRRGGRGA